jgi:hypothetical protein
MLTSSNGAAPMRCGLHRREHYGGGPSSACMGIAESLPCATDQALTQPVPPLARCAPQFLTVHFNPRSSFSSGGNAPASQSHAVLAQKSRRHNAIASGNHGGAARKPGRARKLRRQHLIWADGDSSSSGNYGRRRGPRRKPARRRVGFHIGGEGPVWHSSLRWNRTERRKGRAVSILASASHRRRRASSLTRDGFLPLETADGSTEAGHAGEGRERSGLRQPPQAAREQPDA